MQGQNHIIESEHRNGEYNDDEHEYENENGEEPAEDDNGRVPLLFVDVNLGQGKGERIVVYEGDKSDVLAAQFAETHGNFLFYHFLIYFNSKSHQVSIKL